MQATTPSIVQPSSDKHWSLLRQGNEAGLAGLMTEYHQGLFRYGIRLYTDEMLVRDAIQEVFVSLWERRFTLPNVDSVRFYLLRAVRQQILYQIRQQHAGRQNQYLDDTGLTGDLHFYADYAIDVQLIQYEEAEALATKLMHVLNALPPRQKEVIHLRFYQNLTPAQIAEVLNMRPQSVYNLLHETLRRLRQHWDAPLLVLSGWLVEC